MDIRMELHLEKVGNDKTCICLMHYMCMCMLPMPCKLCGHVAKAMIATYNNRVRISIQRRKKLKDNIKNNNKKLLIYCREGKISDLLQADISYYQVHKIQSIIKCHILLLDFAITTHKPMEICLVSCKNQSRISACVSDDTSSLARVSDDTSNLARVSNDISGPIKL